MNQSASAISCGVAQIWGMDLRGFKEFCAKHRPSGPSGQSSLGVGKNWTYVFSDNDQGRGKDIAQYIRDNDMGDIVEIGWARNPNTGANINTWIWRSNGKLPQEILDLRELRKTVPLSKYDDKIPELVGASYG